jgi:large-conductance mechanosensitive channel
MTSPSPLTSFIVEQGIIGVTIGTTIGFATTNFAKELRKHLFKPLLSLLSNTLKKTRLSKTFYQIPDAIRTPALNLISAVLELGLLLSFVMIIYNYTIVPLFKKELKAEKQTEKRQEEWQQSLLDEVSAIDKKFTMPYGV